MTRNEKSDYLVNKLLFDAEQSRFDKWYQTQYSKTSLRKVRQAAFRKEMEKWLTHLNKLELPVKVFEALEKIERITLEYDEDS